RIGFADVREFDWWDQTTIGELKITFTPTQHSSARGLHDRQRSLWGGYMIETGARPHLFRWRCRLLDALRGDPLAARRTGHRHAWDRRLRAALVHDPDPHEPGRGGAR